MIIGLYDIVTVTLSFVHSFGSAFISTIPSGAIFSSMFVTV